MIISVALMLKGILGLINLIPSSEHCKVHRTVKVRQVLGRIENVLIVRLCAIKTIWRLWSSTLEIRINLLINRCKDRQRELISILLRFEVMLQQEFNLLLHLQFSLSLLLFNKSELCLLLLQLQIKPIVLQYWVLKVYLQMIILLGQLMDKTFKIKAIQIKLL